MLHFHPRLCTTFVFTIFLCAAMVPMARGIESFEMSTLYSFIWHAKSAEGKTISSQLWDLGLMGSYNTYNALIGGQIPFKACFYLPKRDDVSIDIYSIQFDYEGHHIDLIRPLSSPDYEAEPFCTSVVFVYKSSDSWFGSGTSSLTFNGTRWCGLGSSEMDTDPSSPKYSTDKCCMEHDHCKPVWPSGQARHGTMNESPATRLSCKCDNKFRRCLQGAKSPFADHVGEFFFNVLKMKCFKDEPGPRCIENEQEPCKTRKITRLHSQKPYVPKPADGSRPSRKPKQTKTRRPSTKPQE